MYKFKNAKEAAAKRREIQDKLADINDKLEVIDQTLAKRELKDEEKESQVALNREFAKLQREADLVSREYQILYQAEKAEAEKREVKKTTAEMLRELFVDTKKQQHSREVVLGGNADGGIQTSGAVNLNIQDLLPTNNEGLDLPTGVTPVYGVTGNTVWPVSVNDAEMKEVGELVKLDDQELKFDNIKPEPGRFGITIKVSNQAIENAAFDLLSFVQKKFALALRKILALKMYSQAAFTGVKGPFSGATAKELKIDSAAFKNVLLTVAGIGDLGYDMDSICFCIDKYLEAILKATPKAAGQGGFIIENGKLAGYDYVTSHYIDTALDTDGTTIKTLPDHYLGIGVFPYLALQQHGTVRLTIDPISLADEDAVKVTINTEWSMTDLSKKITTNGKKNTTSTAFALYKIVEPTA